MPKDDHRQRQEGRLIRRYLESGDPKAKEQLVEMFQPLARSLAHRYHSGGEPLEDLVQIANVGLLKAIDRFDQELGKPFTAFAAPTILGELRHYFRDHAYGVKLPRRLQEHAACVREVGEAIQAESGRVPTSAEVAEHCDLSVDEVIEAMVADTSRRQRSLDTPARLDDGDSAPIVDLVETDESGFDRAESHVAAADTPLLPKERRVMDLRYQSEMTQREVGEELGISQMQVSRLQRSALLKLLASVRGEDERPEDLFERLSEDRGSQAA